MPIYEYRCAECGHEMEKLQKMSAAALTDCPACGKPGLKKLVSAAGFRLKGGGWYETDFKSGKKKNIAKADSKKAEKTEKSSGTSGSNSKKSNCSASS
ncbi:hypothetical protein MNBD_GAMMA13-1075 [hydrothermal vent metagenome]|uniref:Putative regulatory protein FmdB zinc ribbon domain-containing protein n=1 Tax=hydrothermal vent metagenome TaxID=652676 RepID=A0A3B0Z7K4_9ZZZZ